MSKDQPMDTENPDDAPIDVRESHDGRSNWTIKTVREDTRVRFRRHARRRGMAAHELIDHCVDLLDAEDARTEVIGPTIEQNGDNQGRTHAVMAPAPVYSRVEVARQLAELDRLLEDPLLHRRVVVIARAEAAFLRRDQLTRPEVGAETGGKAGLHEDTDPEKRLLMSTASR